MNKRICFCLMLLASAVVRANAAGASEIMAADTLGSEEKQEAAIMAKADSINGQADVSESQIDALKASAQSLDDIAVVSYHASTKPLLRGITVGAPLIVGGFIAKSQNKGFRTLRNDVLPQFRHHADDYIQYAPAAVMLGMKAAGVKSRSSWGRMLLSDALTAAVMAAGVNAIKYSTQSLRPDGSDHRSFPSGHTATAFMTATMFTKEYGYLSPWVSIGAYTCATTTALMRMANNKHWLSDVMVGAGVGIVSTHFGYYLADLIMGKKGLNRKDETQVEVISAKRRPSFFAMNIGANIPLSKYLMGINDGTLDGPADVNVKTTASLGVEGAYFFTPYVGVGASGSMVDVKFDGWEYGNGEIDQEEDYESSSYYTLMAGPYFNLPLSPRWSIGTKLLYGAVFYPTTHIVVNFDGEKIGGDYRGSHGFCFGTGLNVNYQLEKRLNAGLFANYTAQENNSDWRERFLHSLTLGVRMGLSF